MMKCALLAAAAVISLASGCVCPRGAAMAGPKETVLDSADGAQFKDAIPGVSRAVLWGDPDSGPYGAFTRFAPGIKHALHTHSSDLRTVVLKGAYIYTTSSGEKRVGAGSYFFIPAGTQHTSGADAAEGCLMYEEGSGKFDLIPVEGAAAKK